MGTARSIYAIVRDGRPPLLVATWSPVGGLAVHTNLAAVIVNASEVLPQLFRCDWLVDVPLDGGVAANGPRSGCDLRKHQWPTGQWGGSLDDAHYYSLPSDHRGHRTVFVSVPRDSSVEGMALPVATVVDEVTVLFDDTTFVPRFRWSVPGGRGGDTVTVGDYGPHGLVVENGGGRDGDVWPEHENLARTWGPHVAWYAGGCLADTPSRARFSVEELCTILLGICEGLRVLHLEYGVYHGHVSPAVMYVDRRTNGPPVGVLHPPPRDRPPLSQPASAPGRLRDLRALVRSVTDILGEDAESLWDRLSYDEVLLHVPLPVTP